jgi:hypothetical protein
LITIMLRTAAPGCRERGYGPDVAILVDPPKWPAHGRLWGHMVSDVSPAELHDFAAALGVPRRGFDRDHYDLPEELLTRLTASGLRRPKRRSRGQSRGAGVSDS